jgi:hypothetical protein
MRPESMDGAATAFQRVDHDDPLAARGPVARTPAHRHDRLAALPKQSEECINRATGLGGAVFGRGKTWTKIDGEVLASKRHSSRGSASGAFAQMEYVVEFTVDGAAKRVELVQVMSLNGFMMIDPPVGSSVPLLHEPASGKVKFDVDDPRIAKPTRRDKMKTKRQSETDAYRQALDGDQNP